MRPYVSRAEWHRFWNQVRVVDGADACWEWRGYRLPNGYGLITNRKRRMLVTRWLMEAIWRVDLKRGDCVLHRCNNPSCVRPEHLRIGTQSENTQQSWDEGRRPYPVWLHRRSVPS
jgi:HNH endonuclease